MSPCMGASAGTSGAPSVPLLISRQASLKFNRRNREELVLNEGDLRRILIVDDALMNRKMLCRLIEPYCDVVAEAEDGQQAVDCMRLAVLNNTPFILVLMDYQMPVMDGK